MNRSILRCSLLGILIATVAIAGYSEISGPRGHAPGHVPAEGMVPNEATAKAIASAIILAHYGEEGLKQELPLSAQLVGNGQLWIITGVRPVQNPRLSLVVHIHRCNGFISYLDRSM